MERHSKIFPWDINIFICDQKVKNYCNRHYAPAAYQAHPQKGSHELYTLQLCNANDRSHTWSALYFIKQTNAPYPHKGSSCNSTPKKERILGHSKNSMELETLMHLSLIHI